jgi:hypothetical protein
MSVRIQNWIWMVLCLAALAAFAGCQSGSPLGVSDEALSDSQNVGDQQSPIVADQPALPKGSSDFQQIDPGLSKQLQDMLYAMKHIPLESGENNDIDLGKYLDKSDNATEKSTYVGSHYQDDGYGHMIVISEYRTDIVLQSGTGEMSYVTYGFRNIPEGEQLTKITVRGTMDTQMFNPFGGLYIGVSDYDHGNFRWFGPLGTENEYTLNLFNINTTNSKQRAYVTLAVYNGDDYTVQDLDVKVGSQFFYPGFDWDKEFNLFLNNEGIFDLGRLTPEYFEELPAVLPSL